MAVTTTWKFRQKYLNTYSVDDFENDWEYFVYLHVNPAVHWLHLAGTIVGLSLFPWAMYRLFWHWELLPTVIYTFFYYGVGFISHWTGDGQVSKTWKQLGQTYVYAVRMNIRLVKGQFRKDIAGMFLKYPQTRWVYFKEYAPPAEVSEFSDSGPTSRARASKKSRNSDNLFTS
ncbi:MAG TPA: hypothetical protein VFV50_08230 [Bdellovibrionales bacterium]|nr:hypothetical protein [Bdellovibrionales bacterium]